MISAHSSARLGWAGVVEQRDQHVRHERDGDGAAGQAVETVGDVHAVGRGDDGEGREQRRTATARSATRTDEGDRDGGDRVRLLDLPCRDERDDRQPDELLAGADALPGARVEVVVERAQRSDAGQRGERREGRRVGLPQEEVDAEDHQRR